MKTSPSNSTDSDLECLMKYAAATAETQMRELGAAQTAFVAITPETVLVIPAIGLVEDTDEEAFAAFIRKLSVAESARLGVLIRECWFAALKPGERPAPGVRAYNHPQRREGVLLSGEALGGIYSNRFLPIKRDAGGCFTEFGPAESFLPLPTEGRFSRLLPACSPSARERQAAVEALAASGRKSKSQRQGA